MKKNLGVNIKQQVDNISALPRLAIMSALGE